MLQTFTDEQWVENFRITRQTVNKVCRFLEPDLSPMENTVRDALDVQKQVALMIYWLATPTEYFSVTGQSAILVSMYLMSFYLVCLTDNSRYSRVHNFVS